MDRPLLNKDISLLDFNDFYWSKQELIAFCKTVGIKTTGCKIEISNRIKYYLLTGEILKNEYVKNKSKFNWRDEILTTQTIISENYQNNENVRRFFVREIGSHFSFNIIFLKWMKDNVGKTLEEAIKEWERINQLKKDKNYVSEIAPQFEYNKYIRAFLGDNPNLSIKDAIKCWKLKRSVRGINEYEKIDLELLLK